MSDGWIAHNELDITDDIKSMHCDTRDFHVSLNSNSHSHHCSNKDFMFTTEEVRKLLAELYKASGGKKARDWRFICFVDSKGDLYGGDWQFKYLRFFRVTKDEWILKPRDELKMIRKDFFDDKKCFGDVYSEEFDAYRKECGYVEPEPEVREFQEYATMDDSYIIYNDTHSTWMNSHRISKPPQFRRESPKVHNNEPCTCGSGLKYKKCCKNK